MYSGDVKDVTTTTSPSCHLLFLVVSPTLESRVTREEKMRSMFTGIETSGSNPCLPKFMDRISDKDF